MSDPIQQVTDLWSDAFDYGVYFPEDKALYVRGSLISAKAFRDQTIEDFPGAYLVHVQIERVEG